MVVWGRQWSCSVYVTSISHITILESFDMVVVGSQRRLMQWRSIEEDKDCS